MRGAISGSCRGGPFPFLPEVPPGVRPSSPVPAPAGRPQLLISNRDTNLLETVVTRRKQTTAPTSNRDKNAPFSRHILGAGDWGFGVDSAFRPESKTNGLRSVLPPRKGASG